MNKKIGILIIILLIILGILAGCVSKNGNNETYIKTETDLPSETQNPTITSGSVNRLTTSFPAIATKTEWPLMPTLSYDVQDDFYALLETNGGCELPCFLGITPGETTIEEADYILRNYTTKTGFVLDQVFEDEYQEMYRAQIFTTKDVSLMIGLQFITENNIVEEIRFHTDASIQGFSATFDEHLARYSLREIFQLHGPPDIIYLTPPDITINMSSYAIHVIYEEAKILINLPGSANLNTEGRYRICPNLGEGDIGVTEFTLLNSSNPMDIKTLSLIDFENDDFSFPIDEVLGIGIEDFYTRMLMDETVCFDF